MKRSQKILLTSAFVLSLNSATSGFASDDETFNYMTSGMITASETQFEEEQEAREQESLTEKGKGKAKEEEQVFCGFDNEKIAQKKQEMLLKAMETSRAHNAFNAYNCPQTYEEWVESIKHSEGESSSAPKLRDSKQEQDKESEKAIQASLMESSEYPGSGDETMDLELLEAIKRSKESEISRMNLKQEQDKAYEKAIQASLMESSEYLGSGDEAMDPELLEAIKLSKELESSSARNPMNSKQEQDKGYEEAVKKFKFSAELKPLHHLSAELKILHKDADDLSKTIGKQNRLIDENETRYQETKTKCDNIKNRLEKFSDNCKYSHEFAELEGELNAVYIQKWYSYEQEKKKLKDILLSLELKKTMVDQEIITIEKMINNNLYL